MRSQSDLFLRTSETADIKRDVASHVKTRERVLNCFRRNNKYKRVYRDIPEQIHYDF